MTIPLGPWEKYFLQRQRRDGGMGTSVLIRLDRPLDVRRLRAAAAAVRGAFPFVFSRLATDSLRRTLVAVTADSVAIDSFVTETHADNALAYFHDVAAAPPDPFRDGLMRLHAGTGADPFLLCHTSHVMGDARTFTAVRDALAAAYDGRTIPTSPPFAVLGPDRLRRSLPSAWPSMPALRHRRTPAMALPPGESGGGVTRRLVRCVLDRTQARALVRHGLAARSTPLAWLAGCLAVAVSRWYDPVHREPGDYFALNIPIDLRGRFGLHGRPGNLVYPVGVPLLAADVVDAATAARAVSARLSTGQATYLGFHEVGRALRRAAGEPVAWGPVPQPRESPPFEPLDILGVTEIASHGIDRIGSARVTDYWFESPTIVRRPHHDGSQLAVSVRWHDAMANRVRGFLDAFFAAAVTGEPSPAAAPAWTIL